MLYSLALLAIPDLHARERGQHKSEYRHPSVRFAGENLSPKVSKYILLLLGVLIAAAYFGICWVIGWHGLGRRSYALVALSERVLRFEEEERYLVKAKPLVRDVDIILLDCGLRPEECFRLRWENIKDGVFEIHFGKSSAARRRILMSQRVAGLLEMRKSEAVSEWISPGSHQKRPYRAVQSQEAACPSLPREES